MTENFTLRWYTRWRLLLAGIPANSLNFARALKWFYHFDNEYKKQIKLIPFNVRSSLTGNYKSTIAQ